MESTGIFYSGTTDLCWLITCRCFKGRWKTIKQSNEIDNRFSEIIRAQWLITLKKNGMDTKCFTEKVCSTFPLKFYFFFFLWMELRKTVHELNSFVFEGFLWCVYYMLHTRKMCIWMHTLKKNWVYRIIIAKYNTSKELHFIINYYDWLLKYFS